MRLLGLSRISTRFEQASYGRFLIKGDSAYPKFGVISTYHKAAKDGPPLTAREKAENSVLKVIRESIEWNYGTTAALFKYLTRLEKLQVMKGTKTLKVYTVATILRNSHVLLYGSQTSNFFNLGTGDMPTLEQYLRQT